MTDEAPKAETPKQLSFDFIKSNYFRVVHADGVWGGVTPSGDGLSLTFYSERSPIPTRVTNEIAADGRIAKEVGRQVRDAIVREMEVTVIMDASAAHSFKSWVERHVKALETTQNAIAKRAKESEKK